jgi:hypothetical protein
VFDLEDKGAVPDHYEAEAMLRSAGLHLPLTKQLTRWTRLRHGDMLDPGTRPPKRVLPVVPEYFSWNDGQPYTPPAEVTGDKNGRYVPPRRSPPSHITFLNAWACIHGTARVAIEDVSRELVDMIAPVRTRPEPVTPAYIAGSIAAHFQNSGYSFGLVFRVHEFGRHDKQPIAFQIAAPEGMEAMHGSLKPIQSADPKLQPYADRVKQLADADLAECLPAARGEAAREREMDAHRKAVEQVAAELAAAEQIDAWSARRRLEQAGI